MREREQFEIEKGSFKITYPYRNITFYEEKTKSKRRKNTSIVPKKKKRK